MKNHWESAYAKPENKKIDNNLEKTQGQEREIEEEKESLRAKEIAREAGNYEGILAKLKSEGLWENQLSFVHEKWGSHIDENDFPTKIDSAWEMLTILSLYDEPTTEHCIETYKLLKEKIEKIKTRKLFLAEVLRDENEEMEHIYFASLTHDIGKVCVPPFVLNNSLTNKEWDSLFLEMFRNGELDEGTKKCLALEESTELTDEEILENLKKSGLRSNDVVPIEKGLSETEKSELEEKWNISGKLSLAEIIEPHAKFSGEIHSQKGFEESSNLVRQHHSKKDSGIEIIIPEGLKPNTDLLTVLHLADTQEALKSERGYKKAFPELEVIKKLKEEIKKSDLGRAVSYFWIKNDLNDFLRNSTPESLRSLSDSDKESLEEIDAYVKKLKTGKSGEEIDNWLNKDLRN